MIKKYVVLWSLGLALIGLYPIAQAYQSKDIGANANPPSYVDEGKYRYGSLGQITQPQPEGYDTSSRYGINGAWPTQVPLLANGVGKNLVQAYCSICHNTTYISMQPPLPAGKWTEIVHKMRYTFGAKAYIPDTMVQPITEYLQAHYTPDTIAKNSYDGIAIHRKKVSKIIRTGQEKSSTCANCHGTNGIGLSKEFPNLAGQKYKYLIKQLKAFRSGGRKGTIMSIMAKDLSDQDIEQLSSWFAHLPFTPKMTTSKAVMSDP